MPTRFPFGKGFHALESYRIAHWLWHQGRKGDGVLPAEPHRSELFAMEIHPAGPAWAGAS